MNAVSSASSPITFTGHKMQGSVFGGQQPLVGATIQLYAAGTPASGGAYGSGATALITGTLPTTDSNGAFTFTYNYPASPSFFYLVATGGSPGSGNPANPNIVQIAALGGCAASTTLPISFININELTTAASVMALQPFIGAPTGSAGAPDIGAPATNYNDLRTAFESISKLVDMSSGALVNPTGSKGQLLNICRCHASQRHNRGRYRAGCLVHRAEPHEQCSRFIRPRSTNSAFRRPQLCSGELRRHCPDGFSGMFYSSGCLHGHQYGLEHRRERWRSGFIPWNFGY
jgi:hypothetical protein